MKYFFVINPGSRNGRSSALTGKLLSLIKREGLFFDYAMTTSLEHAYSLSKRANEENYDTVAAVGGDGTINRVLNGFFNNDGKRISRAKMGVIHTGTSPDLCKSYGIPTHPEISARVSQRNIASYLGITPEALSRIRKRISRKNGH
jgi:diacylglycerol kinase family enzyme